MKTIKIIFASALTAILLTSCTAEIYTDDGIIEEGLSLNELLNSYDLWYVDINETQGNGEVPFLQIAFTLSFNRGDVLANNNLAGFGSKGNGYGIRVGFYDSYNRILEIDHDLDGIWEMEVIQHGSNEIELYHRPSNTSYFLYGYMKYNFDYDAVFYDNIQYFLQEYDAWEKVYTSSYGAINEFDEENFLRFTANASVQEFQSSIDKQGTGIHNIYWDYRGEYDIYNVTGDRYLKTLTLDYDFLNNDYFELTVIDDRTIALFHPSSETVYQFEGRGFIQYIKGDNLKTGITGRKRFKTNNPDMVIERMSTARKVKIDVN